MLSGASRTTLHRDLFSLCKVVQGVLRQHCRRFFPVQFCPKSKTRCHRIFSGALLSSVSRTTLHRDLFSLCKVVPGALRHHCRRFFLVESPNKSDATLHKKITCAMPTQSVQTSFCRKVTYAMLS